MMNAIVYHQYGSPDMMKLEQVAKPTPAPEEVLVKIQAASLNKADHHMLRGANLMVRLMGGFPTPKRKILGADFAGRVEAVGSAVTQYKVGDEVYGDLSSTPAGAFAEYAAVDQKYISHKPKGLTFEEAASIPLAAGTALQGLRDKAQLQAGQRVLITGASGGVGTFAVQIAKFYGAHVTATASGGKLDMVRALGADEVIDYTKQDLTALNQKFDLILDIAANRPFKDFSRIMTPTGRYVLVGGDYGRIFQTLIFGQFASRKGGQTFTNLMQKPNSADLVELRRLIEAGALKPLVERTYRLPEVPDAMRYYESHGVRGKIAITVA